MGMIVGLLNNSATWLMRIHFKSSAMNASCLVSLVTHLNWSGFLEKFLVSSDLQQFDVKSNVNTRELKWQATAEYIQKNCVHLMSQQSQRRSEVWLLYYLLCLWYDDMDIVKLEETTSLEVMTKKVLHFDQLRHWQNTGVNWRLLTDFF